MRVAGRPWHSYPGRRLYFHNFSLKTTYRTSVLVNDFEWPQSEDLSCHCCDLWGSLTSSQSIVSRGILLYMNGYMFFQSWHRQTLVLCSFHILHKAFSRIEAANLQRVWFRQDCSPQPCSDMSLGECRSHILFRKCFQILISILRRLPAIYWDMYIIQTLTSPRRHRHLLRKCYYENMGSGSEDNSGHLESHHAKWPGGCPPGAHIDRTQYSEWYESPGPEWNQTARSFQHHRYCRHSSTCTRHNRRTTASRLARSGASISAISFQMFETQKRMQGW